MLPVESWLFLNNMYFLLCLVFLFLHFHSCKCWADSADLLAPHCSSVVCPGSVSDSDFPAGMFVYAGLNSSLPPLVTHCGDGLLEKVEYFAHFSTGFMALIATVALQAPSDWCLNAAGLSLQHLTMVMYERTMRVRRQKWSSHCGNNITTNNHRDSARPKLLVLRVSAVADPERQEICICKCTPTGYSSRGFQFPRRVSGVCKWIVSSHPQTLASLEFLHPTFWCPAPWSLCTVFQAVWWPVS